ncbi:CRISPR-associated helicase Cas3' [Saccharolobus caldissimus]|uniref:CRISPR-associated helicase Cas3 n=1 Tax=Saccharolobus caldissimus TaxID=1702097 RepID=A0AAQ4CRV1_9CREN|nr:CRISPR-associated helicase Cas3' [Saccharolobus caldissimus]BDB98532.1 CRISPR-associated helicase Cas3 [Saccharolobus caldissimus]
MSIERKGIKKIVELFNCKELGMKVGNKDLSECEDVNFILTFPTGYGKTTLSLLLAEYLKTHTTTNFHRLIHVVPTRSLARDIAKSSSERGLRFALQYSFSPSELRSPHFLADFIITTYDSFLLNLYKATIGEPFSNHGHYDLPRFGIFTSLVHFDEFHLMNDGNSWTSLFGAVRYLSKIGVNIILSSATPSKVIEEELIRAMENRKVYRLVVVKEFGQAVRDRSCEEISRDGDFYYYECKVGGSNVKYTTVEVKEDIKVPKIDVNFLQGLDSVVNAVKDNKDKKAIVVVNTVNTAIELYRRLRDLNPCLLHSRFKIRDREEKSISQCGILISTQVIEVGVNISAEVMISEQAPITSIVQRVGRLLRYGEKNEGILYIWKSGNYEPYDKEEIDKTVSVLEEKKSFISLKLPYDDFGYANIVDLVIKKPRIDNKLLRNLEEISGNIFATKEDLDRLLREYCTLTNSFIINVTNQKPNDEGDLIPLDGELAIKVAERCGDKKFVAYLEKFKADRNGVDNVEIVEDCVEIKNACTDYRKVIKRDGERMIILALKVNKEYSKEEGLKV